MKLCTVAPAELEALLLDHPDISDAAVIGIYVEGDELPRAYVALQPGAKAKPEEIAAWLSPRVARHKRLLGGVKIVDSIPKNPVSLTLPATHTFMRLRFARLTSI